MSESHAERVQGLVARISETLDSYLSGNLGLAVVIRDVESAIDALLDVADAYWVERLRSAWLGMEIIYAIALDEGRTVLTVEERHEVDEVVAELQSMLAEALPR